MSLPAFSPIKFLQQGVVAVFETAIRFVGDVVRYLSAMDLSHQLIVYLALVVLSFVCLQALSKPKM